MSHDDAAKKWVDANEAKWKPGSRILTGHGA